MIIGTIWRERVNRGNRHLPPRRFKVASVSEDRGIFFIQNLTFPSPKGDRGIPVTLETLKRYYKKEKR